MPGISIGEAARASGSSVPTIRYYEEIGLLPRAARTSGHHRSYGSSDVEQLILIRRCRQMGMSLAQVRELLEIRHRPETCGNARQLLARHRADLEAQVEELRGLARSLEAIAARCETSCAAEGLDGCTIYAELAER